MEFALDKSTIIHIVATRSGNYATVLCSKVEPKDIKKISRQLVDLEIMGGLKCRRCFSRP